MDSDTGPVIGGVGVGMASVLAPMYISEFAPPRWRGRLVAFYQLSIVVGILLAYYSNWLILKLAQNPWPSITAHEWLNWVLVREYRLVPWCLCVELTA